MGRFWIGMGALVLCFLTVAATAQEATKEKAVDGFDVKKIQGDWLYESGKKAGVASATDMLQGDIKITEKTFTLPGGPDATFVMAYELDAGKDPVQIDFQIEQGPVPEGSAKGIIKMDGGKIVLCYDPTGQQRPEKFESTEENAFNLFVLKKKAD